MDSLLHLAIELFPIDPKTIAMVSDYSCYIGGIVLSVIILKRRMAFRNAKLKIAPPLRWNKFED